MRKMFFTLLFTILAIVRLSAQLPHMYYCDFEDAAENANWVLNKPKNDTYSWVNQWSIGEAVASLGSLSMYISPDEGQHAGYTSTESRIMIAWRELNLEAGHYDIAFDWMCGGDSARAALVVAWVPESQFADMVCKLNDDYKAAKWINDNMLKFNGSELLTGGSVWTHAVNAVESDGTPHRLVYLFACSGTAQLVQPGPCVDNIQLSRNNCREPKNMSLKIVENTADLSWTSTAEEFNLRIHKMGDSNAYIMTGIKQTSISTILQEGVYDIQIQVICEGDTSVWYIFPTAFVHKAKCFDYLDLTDERCSFSMNTPSDYHTTDQQGLLQPGKIDYGFTSMMSRHTIHFHPEEYDARTYNSVDSEGNKVAPLKTVPDGALASVRVGSWEKMARVARVEYDFTVDAREASVLMLQYAMVLESSGHPQDIQRPRMTIDIVDYNTGEALSTCTTVDLASKTSGPGWYRVPDPAYPDGSRDICWRDWETLGLNLAEFHGRHVKVKITAYGCNASTHYGYAYFVLTCTSGQIKGAQCGWMPTRQFIAPEGFNYRWYKKTEPRQTLGHENIFDVDFRDTCTYAVDITYKTNAECGFTLYACAIPRFPIPEATYVLEQRDCGNYITFTNTSHIRTRNWTTGVEIDTSVPVEYVVWDFDGLTPEGLDTSEKLWNPSFRLPDEEADYVIKLYAGVGLCDSIQDFYIHVPRVGQDSIVEKVQLCEGEVYEHNGQYYQQDAIIIDHDYNIAGCDSFYTIDLRFVESFLDTPYDTLVYVGDEFRWRDFIIKAEMEGFYHCYDTLSTSFGCDSVFVLNYEVKPRSQKMYSWLVESSDLVKGTIITNFTEPFYKYGTQITVEALPNYGYHFTQWSDGISDNPRTFVLTQDTTFTAQFAIDKSGTCGKNNALTWLYDDTSKTLAISGNGALTENYTFGLEAPTQMNTLIIGDGITAIGDSAFYGMSSINHLFIGANVASIGDYAFAECRNFDDITCYATIVPIINATTFGNVGNKQYIYLYVPANRERAYKRDFYWGEFDIQIKSAETTTTTDEVTVVPAENTAAITWPAVSGAASYDLVIKDKEGNVICTLIFNAQGQLTSISFAAPSRNNALRQTQAAGFSFTVTGLKEGTGYDMTITAKNDSGAILKTETISFHTNGPEGIDDVLSAEKAMKLFRDGQILILRGDHTYTLTGQEVK